MGISGSDKLTKQIMLSLVAGLLVGLAMNYSGNQEYARFLRPIGDVFIRLLKMMIIPLVLSSIFVAIVNLGDPKKLGRLGGRAISYYFITTAVAALIGIIIVNIVNPGVGVDIGSLNVSQMDGTIAERVNEGAQTGLFQTILNVLVGAIPTNPFESMATMNILQVIVFAILLGGVGLFYRRESEPVIQFMSSLEKMSMYLIGALMRVAPVGIFALMVAVVSESGFDALAGLAKYILAVLVGLFIHFLFLALVGSWRHKISPWRLVRLCGEPVMTAFSTSSSAATLPITMKTVEGRLGVKRETAQFMLPLGATINMDGTALYESVAVIFIGQAYGLDLSIGTQVIIFLTASLAAVGAAAIPSAGLVTMSIVLSAVGFPLEGIGLIFAVDRFLDMFRTGINVFGDCVGTVVVESFSARDAR